MRVLFLDVDGVVCCNRECLLEADKMELLQKICEATKCKVCISSNWRLFDDLRQHLYQQLAYYNIECVGTTPDAGESQHGMPMRPCEIKAWAAEWNGQPADAKNKRPTITSFVALDDRPLIDESGGKYLRDHFVQTHPSIGLTEIGAARAIDLLLNPPASTPRVHSPDSVLSSLTAPWDAAPSSPPKTPKAKPIFGLGASAHRHGLQLGAPLGRRPPQTPQPRAQPFRAPQSAALRSDATQAQQQRMSRPFSSSPASSRLTRPPKRGAVPASTTATGFATPLNQPTVVKIRPFARSPPNSAPNPLRLPPLMG